MIRLATLDDLPAMANVTMAAKAHWGYDRVFLEACRDELSPKPADLGPGLALWEDEGVQGVVHVVIPGDEAHIFLLFVHPVAMGRGIGRALFDWALATARGGGASRLTLDADPYAEGFYRHLGMTRIGEVPSATWPNRMLPLMAIDL
ncbi:GNAT family N-acetyltransferase [Maritimibacter sp. DP1N21-5]|uniref:GNAT family N-acetyltransferase n=1 Tax=Maritimibacter sp. DP1N21-5 TaxID=2836867 RepID=UPI001C46FA7E|nr:GNAT family N-acetyltransferase [Maritimibacter sp. DP1N21-5]MBV7407622.1 GNAT family N-acetyltransferase [Maritimibacter sp. DP1N21-5]